jgi:tRNA(adenine34) deaminase
MNLSVEERTTQWLRRCTLYSNVEPCAMCAYCIREAGLGRVVYALGSPVMGGLSKWNILRDQDISNRIPQVFGPVPEVVSGVLLQEVQEVWREWNPMAWEMIKLRGLLTERCAEKGPVRVQAAQGQPLWRQLAILFTRTMRPKIKTGEPE